MKRLLMIAVSILLLMAVVATPVFAETDGHVAVSPATPNAGELAYVTVSLSGLDNAQSIGVKITPADGLELLTKNEENPEDPNVSKWLLNGMGYINSEDMTAVFAWDKAASVNGDVLELVFSVPEDAEHGTEYTVSVQVEVRDSDKQLCAEETTGTITIHSWKDATCTEPKTCTQCDATEGEAPGHDKKPMSAQYPTCEDPGWDVYVVCKRDGCDYTTKKELEAKGHAWRDATCTLPKTCSTCKKTEGIALGHNEKQHAAQAPTCTKNGWDAYVTCSRCDYSTYKEKAMLGHTEVIDAAVAETCTTAGKTAGTHCSTCGEVMVAQKEIGALGHKEQAVSGRAATCTEKGLTDGKKCSTCGVVTVAQKEIGALGHKEQAVSGKAATCTEKGLTDGKKCSACGVVTVAQKEIAAKGHSFKDGKCGTCGAKDPSYVAPTEPKPTEPKPTEPKPTEPSKPATPTVSGVNRVAGDNRYSTGIEVANQLKTYLGVDKFQAIVVASGREFPDALAGSYLANQKSAPILLVNSKDPKSFENAKAYIAANLVSGGTVYILGGEAAVPKQMVDVLAGFKVKRLAGSNRYGTNLEILKEAGTGSSEILICTGRGFADSLSASAVNKPILLLNNKSITAEQRAFLEGSSKKFIIIGGESAISAEMKAELEKIGSVERVAGDNRYKTSVAVANRFFNAPKTAVVAFAKKFPDGLCGGPLAYSLKAPLILTAAKVEAEASAYTKANGIKDGLILGGTSALSENTVNKVFG